MFPFLNSYAELPKQLRKIFIIGQGLEDGETGIDFYKKIKSHH